MAPSLAIGDKVATVAEPVAKVLNAMLGTSIGVSS